jgi:GT2 family glycosyltransferase
LVSVVTPVYNGAEYLAECLESILVQTYPNWELVILDNRSTDATLEIARRYASKDSRIRVCENPQFLPAIQNHNAALRLISPGSKYCKMVFADDWIYRECLERMVAVAEENPSVGLVSAYCLWGEQVICTGLPYSKRVVFGLEIGRRHFLDRLHLFGSANSVLYRADLVRGKESFYNESNVACDTEVCFSILKTSDFGFVHQVLTYSRVRPESRHQESQRVHVHLAAMLRDLREHGPHFLTSKELDVCLGNCLRAYYDFLARSLARGDLAVLTYHHRQLRELGVGFSWLRLTRAALEALGRAALNPGDTISRMFHANRHAA